MNLRQRYLNFYKVTSERHRSISNVLCKVAKKSINFLTFEKRNGIGVKRNEIEARLLQKEEGQSSSKLWPMFKILEHSVVVYVSK
jgi:hypothetical protein